ncbi:MAG: PIN domain-containing protein [Deltaproteobacteria bacterium]|nr:PIN domain-containing protein [Deltaproteobacteria bacterium]
MIFLDTSAVYAMADQGDPNHGPALEKFNRGLATGEILCLHNYILVESAALLRARLGLQVALQFLKEAKVFQIEWVDHSLHERAVRELKRIGTRGVSFVDCLSFVVMREKGIKRALAFDPDFTAQGFVLY